MSISKWWYLDLMADYPELEIYTGGWGPDQELELIELGERVVTCPTDGLFFSIYSREIDRLTTAVGILHSAVYRKYQEAGKELPDGWQPDWEAWEEAIRQDRESRRNNS